MFRSNNKRLPIKFLFILAIYNTTTTTTTTTTTIWLLLKTESEKYTKVLSIFRSCFTTCLLALLLRRSIVRAVGEFCPLLSPNYCTAG